MYIKHPLLLLHKYRLEPIAGLTFYKTSFLRNQFSFIAYTFPRYTFRCHYLFYDDEMSGKVLRGKIKLKLKDYDSLNTNRFKIRQRD